MAAPARVAPKLAVDRNSLLYKLKKWFYYSSVNPQLGLRKDDIILESSEMTPVLKEALRRIPREELDARNFRLLRANYLSMKKIILPRNEWTVYEEDEHYLQPYIKEVQKEIEEKKMWDSL